ncbi:MAG TPA: tungsten ABC transporter substrate-binding protein, partial [Actinobacteria bacterium]|nr:tungsten ABC transporter substrate-binding protein [Actinomycetes bacterium]HEX21565.1 tungsten ABC transporter substrate-binding protein [Actinomycetota bacterium]
MLKKRFFTLLFLVLILTSLLVAVSGCQSSKSASKPVTNLILATTTSLQDSGLLDKLIPAFEQRYPYRVKTLALGTGEALATAARGEADVILVHAPKAELKFKAQGYGIKRRSIAYNYFVIIGPSQDPAKVGAAKNAAGALRRIAATQALFISRG